MLDFIKGSSNTNVLEIEAEYRKVPWYASRLFSPNSKRPIINTISFLFTLLHLNGQPQKTNLGKRRT